MKPPYTSTFLLLALAGAVPAFAQDALQSGASTYNETRLSTLEEEVRAINGRVEQVEFAVRRLDQTLQRMQSDNEGRLSKLESEAAASSLAAQSQAAQPLAQPVAPPVAPLPQQIVPLSAAPSVTAPIADTNGTLGALKLQNGKVTGAVNNPQSPALPAAPADYGLTAQEQYDRAFSLLRQANYPEAESAFKSFIDKNPKDKLVDNAKYWYGETLYVRARFDESAVAFADAYQQNPLGSKAPDSLLKLAMSLGALNKVPDACVTLNELKTKYPGAAATIKSRADDERSRLKCSRT